MLIKTFVLYIQYSYRKIWERFGQGMRKEKGLIGKRGEERKVVSRTQQGFGEFKCLPRELAFVH